MGETDNREGDEKPVSNWQAAKKPSLPLASKSSVAMPSTNNRPKIYF